MIKKILIVISIILITTMGVSAQLSGTYSPNSYFYKPGYGSSGLLEFQQFNDYIDIADTQIEANKQNSFAVINTLAKVETALGIDIIDSTEIVSPSDIKLDDLGTPDDNTDLNASTTAHGLLPKLPNVATQFLDGTGTWDNLSLTDMSDVNTSTPTDKYVLVADGTDFESRQLSSDDLTDVASIAMLDENETVTGIWQYENAFKIQRYDNTSPPYFLLKRGRDGGLSVQSGDILGNMYFSGLYAPAGLYGATIRAIVDGTPGSYDMPGRLEFLTTPDGSSTPSLRMAIDSAGNVKMGDGAWTNYVNIDNSGEVTFNGTASINEPTIYSRVTTKTTATTLNVNEAGTVLVSAASNYIITLPTAVGNKGLTYHFKKTDNNTNLITIDGNASETIDGALTYTDLNYQYAYVTIISDNSNWYIIGESTIRGGTF